MSEEQALQEIRQQLLTRSDNKVWIDDWRQRYAALSPTPKEFMLRHPDKFTLHFTGNRFTVTLVQGGGHPGHQQPLKRFPGPIQPVQQVHPVTHTPHMPYQRFGWAKGGFGGAAAMALPSPMGSEEEAIQEIRRQLSVKADGYVWIQDWNQRFGHLAPSQRSYVESRPDLFHLIWEGKRYHLSYVGPEIVQVPKAGSLKRPLVMGTPTPMKAARIEETQGTAEEAVELMVAQLRDPKNTQGKVWIDNWHTRFRHLGVSPRELMFCYPEVFEVTCLDNNKFTTRLVDQDE